MRSFVATNTRRGLAVLTLAVFAVLFTLPTRVFAETTIETQLCDGTMGSTITIQTPLSGDTITQLPVTVFGLVANASQIEVTVDGVYDSTIPVGGSQTDYSFDLRLSDGTHTIKLTANDRCHYQNGTADLVLTYRSNTPSNGSITDTNTTQGGQTTSGTNTSGIGTGVQIGTDTGAQPTTTTPSGPIAMLLEPLQTIATALDVDSTLKDGAAQGALRFSLIVSGAFMASVGSASYVSVLQFFRQAVRASRVKQYFAVRHVMRESAFRFGGLVLFALAFLI